VMLITDIDCQALLVTYSLSACLVDSSADKQCIDKVFVVVELEPAWL